MRLNSTTAALVLSLMTLAGSARAAEAEAASVVALDKGRAWRMDWQGRAYSDALSRELARQAFLIAARDELGQRTADIWLGEPLTAQSDNTFEVVTAGGSPPLLEVLRGAYPAQASVWQQVLQTPHGPLDYRWLLEQTEGFSRKEFVEVLQAAGVQGQPPALGNSALPKEIETLIDQLDLVSQFVAIRSLHALIRTQGESPALLGGLVRAYANLGLETEYFWHPLHDVCKARAMLYAQRMLARGGNRSLALAHRSYACALAGLPKLALADLQELKQAGGKTTPPPWSKTLEHYCRFELAPLEKEAEAGSQLALLLHYLAIEHEGVNERREQIAIQLLPQMPEQYRVWDGLAGSSGLGAKRLATTAAPQIVAERLYPRLLEMSDLPAAAEKIARRLASAEGMTLGEEFVARVSLVEALRAGAAAEARQGEFSYAALALMIEELSFTHCVRGVWAYLGALGLPPDEYVEAVAPLTAGHAYHRFLQGVCTAPGAGQHSRALLETIDVDRFGPNMLPVLFAAGGNRILKLQLLNLARARADATSRDLGNLLVAVDRPLQQLYTRDLLWVCPYSPLALSRAIDNDWGNVKGRLPELEASLAEHPAVALALAKRFHSLRDVEQALRYYKAANDAAPSYQGAKALAELYRQQGQMDHWLETLQTYADQPNLGLEGARIQVQISEHYKQLHRWDDALKYAEAAAATGAEWALFDLAEVYEALQRWDDCERLYAMIADRYSNALAEGYFFCKRTGQGDQKAAQKLSRQVLRVFASGNASQLFDVALIHQLEGRPKDALKVCGDYIRRFDGSPYYCLSGALLADELQETAQRDEYLERGVKDGLQFVRGDTMQPRRELVGLCQLFVDDLKAGGKADLNAALIEMLLKQAPDAHERLCIDYFVGRYYALHGQPDKAVEHWKRCMLITGRVLTRDRTLAGAALLARGHGPDSYAEALQAPLERAEP